MKTIVRVVFIVILTIIVFHFSPQLRELSIRLLPYQPCDSPIQYKLGSIDPKFEMNQSQAMTHLSRAADIWDKTYGKPLFAATTSATLTVNFVYDERSALDQQIDTLHTQLDQKNTTIQKQVKVYEADLAAFEKKLAAFNAQVDQWNQSGGAPHDVYNDLISQQNELNKAGNTLNVRARQLNLATRNFNTQVNNLNQNVTQFNQALTQKPEEGLYDGNKKTITIYFANNEQELVHTLAHEFGHALNMQHTSSPISIMYPNSTESLTVTEEDKQQLVYACRKQQLLVHWVRELALSIRTIIKSSISSK